MMKWFQRPAVETRPILDDDYLQRLANHIGETETRELMADGMLELSDRLDRLETLGAEGRLEAVASLTHEIAGAAGHQGLAAMSHAAAEASRIARGDDPPPARKLAETVLRHRRASIEALSAYCAGAALARRKPRA